MANEYIIRNGIITKNDSFFETRLSATTISATTYLNLPGRYEKIVLRKVELGSRAVNAQGDLVTNLRMILTKREIFDVLESSSFTGTKIDYYFTINDISDGKRKKILWTTQTIGLDFDADSAFTGLCNFINDTYGAIYVNFYCEVYLVLDNEYSAPTQMNLVNPLYNSLNPSKYSVTRSWTGKEEFVRNVNNGVGPNSYNSNTIYSDFQNSLKINYYNTLSSEDIPKKIYEIVNEPIFYGELSGNAQTVINVGSWGEDVREVVKRSVYVEPIKKFYSKFKIPVNLNGFHTVDSYRLNNFYGNLLYDIGGGYPSVYTTNADTDTYSSTTAGQFIDTYKIYPKGDKGFIYYSQSSEENTQLNDLSYSVGSSKFSKYISQPTSYREFGSYIQVLPGISDTYSLKINFSGSPTLSETQAFIIDIFNNYTILNDYSVNKNNISWSSITSTTSNLLNLGISLGEVVVVTSTTFDNIFIGGDFYYYDQTNNNKIAALTTGGTLDTNFDFGGGFNVQGYGFSDWVYSIATQTDGKILVGGSFSSYGDFFDNYSRDRICRLNSDGSFDNSFNVAGGGFNDIVNTIAIQNDGKILVGGIFLAYYDSGGTYDVSGIVRLNSDGTFDPSFIQSNILYGFNSQVNSIAIQSDGKILVGGSFDAYGNSGGTFNCYRIARLNTDGTFDTTFLDGVGGYGFNNTVTSIAIQSDGKIVCGGSFTQYTDEVSTYSMFQITRLNSDGTFDTSFNGLGLGFADGIEVNSIVIQPDGKILIGGIFSTYYDIISDYPVGNILRLNTDGTFDTTFTYGAGIGFNDSVLTLSLQSDGKILVGGDFGTYNDGTLNFMQYIMRLNSNGTFDSTFNNSGVGFSETVRAISILQNGKILCGGQFTQYTDQYELYNSNYIAKLTSDGIFDTGNGIGIYDSIKTVSFQNDGKILIGGAIRYFTNSGVTYVVGNILRLNSDGTFDTTFLNGNPYGFDYYPDVFAIQSDGKILVGGTFTQYTDTIGTYNVEGIVRLNSDGTFDTTFYQGGIGFDDAVYDIKIQEDGKILVGGRFTQYITSGGTDYVGRIARLNSNGSLDPSFISGLGLNFTHPVYSIVIQPDGKILCGGDMLSYYDSFTFKNINRICRLNNDGTFDDSFLNSGAYGFDGRVTSISLTKNGKIICGGGFDSYDDTSGTYYTSWIAKLNSDGGFDISFNNGVGYGFSKPGPGKVVAVLDVKVLPDDKILVGGFMNTYEDSTGTYSLDNLARLYPDGLFDTSFNSGNSEASSPVNSIALKILTGTGTTLEYSNIIIQSNDEKMLELSQNPTYTFTSTTESLFDIYAGGIFGQYTDTNSTYEMQSVSKLTSGGTFNPSFLNGVGYGFNDGVRVVKPQLDGKILCGGDFSQFIDSGGTYVIQFITRLNSDGSFDTSFVNGVGYGTSDTVFTIATQPDGKILVGGSFVTYTDNTGTYTNWGIVRLNIDGTYDTTFNNGGTGFFAPESDASIKSIKIQSDGKIVVGGYFTGYNDFSGDNYLNSILRLNSDGSYDNTFNIGGTGVDKQVLSVAIQSDGKILIGGSISEYIDGTSTYNMDKIMRLNSDGTFDTTFNSGGSGFDGWVRSIDIQTNGKIICGGSFGTYIDNVGSYVLNYVAGLNSDGTYDTTFLNGLGYGFEGDIYSIKIQEDGKILCGGEYGKYSDNSGNHYSNNIARLNIDGTFDSTFDNGGNGFNNRVYSVDILVTEPTIITNTINVDAIYKGHSFRPLIYPLNLTQLILDVPESFFYDGSTLEPSKNSNNNLFEYSGFDITNKKLCLVINYKKLNKYDIIQENLEVTYKRGSNNIFTMLIQNVENTIMNNVSINKSKNFRPGSVEIYFAFMDVNSFTISKIPNYKMIVANYGDNEIFKLVREGQT